MRQLYLVSVKCKHVKFMSEKSPALSLCFKLGINTYFSLLSIWTLLKTLGQANLKKKIQWSYLLEYDIMSPLFLIIKLSFRC